MKIISGKKGQSALEFLTTYGWALLIMVVMAGALVSFGVFSPTSKGNSCISSTGIVCIDSQINASTVQFALTNGLGDINNMAVTVTRLNTGVVASNCDLYDGTGKGTAIKKAVSGQRVIIKCASLDLSSGSQEAFDALITYNKQNGAFPQTSKVSLSGVVQ